jgi:hypothetical protein
MKNKYFSKKQKRSSRKLMSERRNSGIGMMLKNRPNWMDKVNKEMK